MARLQWIKDARPSQIPPPGEWFGWLLQAGRGFGKTRPGAEEAFHFAIWNDKSRVAVIAPTQEDLRKTVFGGQSGLLNIIPSSCLRGGSPERGYNSTHHELYLANGSILFGYSAEKPARLRGPQFHFAWCDELAAWEPNRQRETWDMLMLALRLGTHPRVIVTTTPKPYPLIRELNKRVGQDFVLTTGSTYDNRANLAPTFFTQVTRYEGTELGRQEIHAELIDLSETAILKRPWWRIWTKLELPKVELVVLSFDTAFKDAEENDPTAMTRWGLFRHREREDDEWEWHAILLKAWKEKLLYPDLREKAQAEIKLVKDEFGEEPDWTLIEDKASGQSLIQELNRAGVRVFAYNPGRDGKLLRAHVQSDVLKGGRLWVPGKKIADNQPRSTASLPRWAEDVVSECEAFRGMDEDDDDYVDTVVQFSAVARDHYFALPSDPPPRDEDNAPPQTRRSAYG